MNNNLLPKESEADFGRKQDLYKARGKALKSTLKKYLPFIKQTTPTQFLQIVRLHSYLYEPLLNAIDRQSIDALVSKTMKQSCIEKYDATRLKVCHQ